MKSLFTQSLIGLAMAVLLLGPGVTLAAPPAVTAATATVTVNPTTGEVVFPSARQLVQTFTDATRAATAPVASGQLAFETDTHLLWYGTGSTAGNWAQVVPPASETAAGRIEIATQAETNTGTDDTRAVTPAKLQGKLDTMLGNEDSSFRISDNGGGGYKLELWNADQSTYQEIRLAGAPGAERLVIVAAP